MKIDQDMEILAITGNEKTLENGKEPKTRVLGYHKNEKIFEIEDDQTISGDVVFIDDKYLIFSNFYSGIAICDATILKKIYWKRHPQDGDFGNLLANNRYVFETIGEGHEGHEDTLVMDKESLEPVTYLAGGYDSCLNKDWFIAIPQASVELFDAKNLKHLKSEKTHHKESFNFNVTSSGEYVAVNNGQGEIMFFSIPELKWIKTIVDKEFKAIRKESNFI